jgi:hypothetical protein
MKSILETTGDFKPKSKAEQIREKSFDAARASDKTIPTLRSLQATARNFGRAAALSRVNSQSFVRIAKEHRNRKDNHAPDRFVCGKTKLARRADAWKWTSFYCWCAENDRPATFYTLHMDSEAMCLPEFVHPRFAYDPQAIERIKSRLAELFGNDPFIAKLEVGEDEKLHLHVLAPRQSNPVFYPLENPEAAKRVHDYFGVVGYMCKASVKPYYRLEGEFIVAQILASPKQLPRSIWQAELPMAPKHAH